MPSFVVFILVLGGIWTLSGISTWLNKQKEAERRQRLREQMARAGVNVPIAAPIVSQTPRQISASIAQRFPDVLLPPSPQRPLQPPRLPQIRPQGRQPQRRPARLPVNARGGNRPQVQRPQSPAAAQPPAAPQSLADAFAAMPSMAPARPAATASAVPLQSPSRSATTASRMTAASLARWMNPKTLNQQFLLSEIFQPPVGLRDPSAGL